MIGDITLGPGRENDRYIPRALNGGPGWAIWDRLHNRFLTDDECEKLTVEALETEQLPCQ